jgi:hypothetical protein
MSYSWKPSNNSKLFVGSKKPSNTTNTTNNFKNGQDTLDAVKLGASIALGCTVVGVIIGVGVSNMGAGQKGEKEVYSSKFIACFIYW